MIKAWGPATVGVYVRYHDVPSAVIAVGPARGVAAPEPQPTTVACGAASDTGWPPAVSRSSTRSLNGCPRATSSGTNGTKTVTAEPALLTVGVATASVPTVAFSVLPICLLVLGLVV